MKRSNDRNRGPKPLAGSAAQRIEAIVEGAERAAEKVIDDAEAQARAYVAEAQAEGDRAVAERLASLAGLSDALAAQADAIRRQSELLAETLREAQARLEREGRAPEPEPQSAGFDDPALERLAGSEEPRPAGPFAEPTDSTDEDRSSERQPDRSHEPAPPEPPAPRPEPARAPYLTAVEPAAAALEPELTPEPAASARPAGGEVRRGTRPFGTPNGARLLATQMAVSGSSREEIAARLRSGFEIEDTDSILDAILGPEG